MKCDLLLGDSRSLAFRQLLRIERKLVSHTQLRICKQFMDEPVEMHHMELEAVLKEKGVTTKLRLVLQSRKLPH